MKDKRRDKASSERVTEATHRGRVGSASLPLAVELVLLRALTLSARGSAVAAVAEARAVAVVVAGFIRRSSLVLQQWSDLLIHK